jgi:hypothetical protein
MPGLAFGAVGSKRADVEVAQAEAPKFEKVQWYKDSNMRKLYFYCSVLLVSTNDLDALRYHGPANVFAQIASATTGFDGQMMVGHPEVSLVMCWLTWSVLFQNTSQLMDPWKEYFDHPEDHPSRLGLMSNAYNIGSIISLFLVPWFTDK